MPEGAGGHGPHEGACARPALGTQQLLSPRRLNERFLAQVGYTVRFDDLTSEATRIKFLTDGMLLREAISDSLLRKYSCVVLDEAHERTVHTDVLFGVVKAAQKRRKELGKLPLKVGVVRVQERPEFLPRPGAPAHPASGHGGTGLTSCPPGWGRGGGDPDRPGAALPSRSSVPNAGDRHVRDHGRGSVLALFQRSARPLPGGSAAPHPGVLHQTAAAGLPARRARLRLPDPPGAGWPHVRAQAGLTSPSGARSASKRCQPKRPVRCARDMSCRVRLLTFLASLIFSKMKNNSALSVLMPQLSQETCSVRAERRSVVGAGRSPRRRRPTHVWPLLFAACCREFVSTQ